MESLVTMDQHGLKLGWIIHNNITMKLQILSVYSQIQAQENGFLLRNDKLLRNNSYCVRNIFCTNRPEGGRESSKNNSENGKPISPPFSDWSAEFTNQETWERQADHFYFYF